MTNNFEEIDISNPLKPRFESPKESSAPSPEINSVRVGNPNNSDDATGSQSIANHASDSLGKPKVGVMHKTAATSLLLFGKTVKSINNFLSDAIGTAVKLPIIIVLAITALDAVLGVVDGLVRGMVSANFDSKLNPDTYGGPVGFLAKELSAKLDIGLSNFTPDVIIQASENIIHIFTQPANVNIGNILASMFWNNPAAYLIPCLIGAGVIFAAKGVIWIMFSFVVDYSFSVAYCLREYGEPRFRQEGKLSFLRSVDSTKRKLNKVKERFKSRFTVCV